MQKDSLFCSAWLMNSAVDAMSCVLKRCFATLCGYLPLSIMSCGAKEGFGG